MRPGYIGKTCILPLAFDIKFDATYDRGHNRGRV